MTEVTPAEAVARLADLFHRSGYVRRQNPDRLAAEGRGYKKGDEIRLVADTAGDLKVIRQLLRAAGFDPGRPFQKSNQWRQPVYGRAAVARFLALVGTGPAGDPPTTTGS